MFSITRNTTIRTIASAIKLDIIPSDFYSLLTIKLTFLLTPVSQSTKCTFYSRREIRFSFCLSQCFASTGHMSGAFRFYKLTYAIVQKLAISKRLIFEYSIIAEKCRYN